MGRSNSDGGMIIIIIIFKETSTQFSSSNADLQSSESGRNHTYVTRFALSRYHQHNHCCSLCHHLHQRCCQHQHKQNHHHQEDKWHQMLLHLCNVSTAAAQDVNFIPAFAHISIGFISQQPASSSRSVADQTADISNAFLSISKILFTLLWHVAS